MLRLVSLFVSTKEGGKEILKGLNLEVMEDSIHAIMGPNGSGKSTLAQVVAGNPFFEVVSGDIVFEGKSITNLSPDERAALGIFLSFQHPIEVPGVNVANFLRMIYNKRFNEQMPPVKFRKLLEEKMKIVDIKPEFAERYLNDGFSGGEKKRMEILQMLILEPKLTILDEIDSGLDVDALKSVAESIKYLKQKNKQASFIIITHHARILDHINPDFVHILKDGQIVKSGGFELAKKLEKTGFKEFGEDYLDNNL